MSFVWEKRKALIWPLSLPYSLRFRLRFANRTQPGAQQQGIGAKKYREWRREIDHPEERGKRTNTA